MSQITKSALTAEQRLDMVFGLVNQLNVYDEKDFQRVSMINSIILGEDVVNVEEE